MAWNSRVSFDSVEFRSYFNSNHSSSIPRTPRYKRSKTHLIHTCVDVEGEAVEMKLLLPNLNKHALRRCSLLSPPLLLLPRLLYFLRAVASHVGIVIVEGRVWRLIMRDLRFCAWSIRFSIGGRAGLVVSLIEWTRRERGVESRRVAERGLLLIRVEIRFGGRGRRSGINRRSASREVRRGFCSRRVG